MLPGWLQLALRPVPMSAGGRAPRSVCWGVRKSKGVPAEDCVRCCVAVNCGLYFIFGSCRWYFFTPIKQFEDEEILDFWWMGGNTVVVGLFGASGAWGDRRGGAYSGGGGSACANDCGGEGGADGAVDAGCTHCWRKRICDRGTPATRFCYGTEGFGRLWGRFHLKYSQQ